MGGVEHLLVRAHFRHIKLVLNRANPVIRIHRLRALGENRWISPLEILQLGPWRTIAITTIIVVVVARCNLGKVLEGGKVSGALSSRGLTILHHDAKQLSHGWLGWWWRVAVRAFLAIVVPTRHSEHKRE